MIVTALIMGLAGSLHCLGMCSPLAMAVTNMNSKALLHRTMYNAGRILTYSLLGALVSSLGYILPLLKFQNLISIILGMLLLIAGLGLLRINVPFLSRAAGSLTMVIKTLFASFLKKKTLGSVFVLGTLNGFLPCGLILIALSFCVTLKTAGEGMLFMLFFGIGTLPAMLGATGFLPFLFKRLKLNMLYLTRGMLITSGLLLIARVYIVSLHHQESIRQGIVDIVLCR
jgi:sulfite exporter TauE/SafE